jgi:two-component system, response regulator
MSDPLILLVEDNPDDEELTRLALGQSGVAHSLVVARDGAEALDYLLGTGTDARRDARVMPSLVLLDLKLPKVDGLEVLRRLRQDERTRLIPAVVLSTSLEQRDVTSACSLGANSYIRKPVDFDQFMEVMRQVGRYWLAVNEHPLKQRKD